MKRKLVIAIAFLAGMLLGVYLSHPRRAEAQYGFNQARVIRVTEGIVDVHGSTVLGFSCTTDACYVLAK